MTEYKILSTEMHHLTERPGETYNLDAIKIITDRYEIAAQLSAGKDVLEVGVGQGYGIQAMSNVSKSYVGLEYSQENISLIRNSYGLTSRIIRADGEKLPFRSETFDLVCGLAMVYYMNLEEFAGEAYRVLKKGGALFFDTSNPSLMSFTASPHAVEYNNSQDIVKKLKSIGFDVVLYGAFPEPTDFFNHPLVRIKFGRAVRRTLKLLLPRTRIWSVIRNWYFGGEVTLPPDYRDLRDRYPKKAELDTLPAFSHDRRFRVIYCYAIKT